MILGCVKLVTSVAFIALSWEWWKIRFRLLLSTNGRLHQRYLSLSTD